MLAMLNPGPGWLEDAEEESDCEKAPAVIPSIMASSRRNLRMRNLSFGKTSTTTAEILSPPFQMSKQPTRRIFALSSEFGTSSLGSSGSSGSRASGQCLRPYSMVWHSRNSGVPPPRLLGAGRGSPPSFGGSCCCPRSLSWSTRPAFSWLRRATSISSATFFLSSSLAYCRRHGGASGGPLAVSQKLRARALNLHPWLGRFHCLE